MTTTRATWADTSPAAAVSEWGSERLDLDAYLTRVGYGGGLAPSASTLRALHRAHAAAVPFENLDIVLGRGIPLDIESLQDKVVRRRRGGYCYEHNLLFGAALERLGYPVTRLVARVRPDRSGPRTHMLLRVEAGGGSWLADVGFGGGVLEPIPLEHATTARQGGWTYRLDRGHDGAWLLRSLRPDGASSLYSFTLEPHRWADYELINYYTSTHPNSPFTGRVVAMRIDERAHDVLAGRNLTTTYPNGASEHRSVAHDELAAALADTFGIRLDDPRDEVRLRAVPPRRPTPTITTREQELS